MEEDSDEDLPEPAAPAPGPAAAAEGSDPNPILFIEGLPSEITAEMLNPLFQQSVSLASPISFLQTPLTPHFLFLDIPDLLLLNSYQHLQEVLPIRDSLSCSTKLPVRLVPPKKH